MTYLFVVIGIAVINALSNRKTSYAELATINVLIFSAALLKERIVVRTQQSQPTRKEKKAVGPKRQKHTVEYDKLEWLGPAHRAELLADLSQRTGIDVLRVQIRNIDLRNSTATLTIWYDDPDATTA